MEKAEYSMLAPQGTTRRRRTRPQNLAAAGAGLLFVATLLTATSHIFGFTTTSAPAHAASTLARCRSLHLTPAPQAGFYEREESDRFEPDTKPILIKNAKIWTGNENGTEVIKGDILLDRGIIKGVGQLGHLIKKYSAEVEVIHADGAWVTPGIVDVHSHLGVDSSPALRGSSDTNSVKSTILPHLRSLDGLNTHDDAYPLSISGGVTTALILPGSANAIGGQAFVIKLRKTSERSPTSMLLEPPYTINGTSYNPNLPPRWRHMKHACGENPSRVHGVTRMDTFWSFREAYNRATILKNKQDEYCARAMAHDWKGLGEFPEDLQWEALVDVLRGRVKVNTHCYEAVDLDDFIRLTNEFKFPLAAFHHAHETYLVPDVLKRAYGKPPAVALFATNARYKREAFRGSEFAPRILSQHGLTVVMKSDHPVLDSRHLLYEAQQAHYYGFADNLALAAVTSNSATVMGMDHRIGFIRKGWDADLVIWDSHPLALGATPTQVFIDGIPQLTDPVVLTKPDSFQKTPKVPNFDKEAEEAVKYEGLPPLEPKESLKDVVIFTNVKSVFTRSEGPIQTLEVDANAGTGVVVTSRGKIICSGSSILCEAAQYRDRKTVDLEGGSIAPGLLSYGSALGLEHIDQEASTRDGYVYDPLVGPIPKISGPPTTVARAADGLSFSSRDALLAYRSGVTGAITAPSHRGFYGGLGTYFSTGVKHKLEKGAILKEVTGVHMSVQHFGIPSVSTQIGVLRNLLLGPHDSQNTGWHHRVIEGEIPLVIEAHSADVIATLVLLKKEVDYQKGSNIRLTITGATEAHLLAKELSGAGVGVVVNPSRPFPAEWEDKRMLAGPPLTNHTTISALFDHGVTVGFGTLEKWNARNARFDIAWAALEANGKIGKEDALALGSTNLEKLLGAEVETQALDLVATKGGDLLEMSSKVVAIISPQREVVDLL